MNAIDTRNVLDPSFATLATKLKDAFNELTYGQTLLGGFKALYPASEKYVTALLETLNPAGGKTNNRIMDWDDFERCLIAILAAREPGLELAIHIYAGLARGLSVDDVAATLHVAGVYTGVDNFGSGLMFFKEVLLILEKASAEDATPPKILLALTENYGRTSRLPNAATTA